MKRWFKTKSCFLKAISICCWVLCVSSSKAQLNGGSIAANGSPSSASWYCDNTINGYPTAINSLQAAYNGTSPYVYEWMFSFNGATWQNIASSNSASLSSLQTGTFTYYKRKVTDATTSVAYSNTIQINKCVFFDAGSIKMYPTSSTSIYCADYITIPAGYTPPIIQGPSTASISSTSPANFDWWKSTTSLAGPYSYAAFGVSYQPPAGQNVGIVYYKRRASSYECSCINDASSYSNELLINYVASNPFDAGTVVPNNSNAVIGNTINFNASTAVSGGIAPYYYQWQDSIAGGAGWNDISSATSATYQTTLTQHKYFRRRAWDSNCKIAFSSNQYLRSINNIALFVNSNVNSYAATNVSGNYWFDVADVSGNIVASINPGTNNLGTVTVQAKHFGTGVSNIPANNSQIPFMPRYFEISSSSYPTGNIPTPVSIRLYYKNSELTDFKSKILSPSFTVNDLRISHYHGINQDCDVNNNTPGGTVTITPTNTTFADGFYLQFSANSFSEFGAVSKNLTLPVSWLSFTGKLKDKEALLKWNVASQVNNKGFNVQRSSNGQNFQDIGFVQAASTTTSATYSFIDKSPISGTGFYRLQQVDNNGTATYSNIITVKTNSKYNFTVFPNPVADAFFVQSGSTETIRYTIVNAVGQVVKKGTTINNQKIDASNLPKGTYALQLFTETEKEVLKITKQ